MIPDYQTVMLPLLKLAGDQEEHENREAVEMLADHFDLTEEERKERLPSGSRVFANRLGWAKTYLAKAGLLESTRRGHFKITETGLHVLKDNPEKIDNTYLEQFPAFIAFVKASRPRGGVPQLEELEELEQKTPEEFMKYGYEKLHRDLVLELLDIVRECSPAFFEELVVDLLLKMGYGGSREDAGKAIGKSGDGGIDGIIKEDKLGLDIVYIQAKKWESTVGCPDVQKFAGALQGKRARKGIFITTSTFSKQAREYVSQIDSKIVLIEGEQLAELMIENDIGVYKVASYKIKRVDSDYFIDELKD
ncbi:MAG: restriction endonuclease [Theionarchaea archaeon]|nr:restriction endonuclease [Theionarchaea archaeon]